MGHVLRGVLDSTGVEIIRVYTDKHTHTRVYMHTTQLNDPSNTPRSQIALFLDLFL